MSSKTRWIAGPPPAVLGWYWVIGFLGPETVPAFVCRGMVSDRFQIMTGRTCYYLDDVAQNITHHAEMAWPERPR